MHSVSQYISITDLESTLSARFLVLVFIWAIVWTPPASAVNGIFLSGYGPTSIGVGGTGVAMPQDRMAGAINPAGLAFVEPGLDLNLRMIHPQRAASIDCTGIGACDRPVSDRSNRELFVLPHIGYSRRLDARTTLGAVMYVNGGMNTAYSRAIYNESAARILGGRPGDPGFPVRDKLGIDYSQMIFAPSIAYRYTDRLTVGLSPLFSVQRFAATGLASFARQSADPTSLTNRGTEYVVGGGVRVGAIVEVTDGLRVGAQYTSPIFMQRYSEYNGLFPDGGSFDSPPHYTIGVAWDIDERLTLGFDYQRVIYEMTAAFANPGPTPAEAAGIITSDRRLGGSNGMGFGWTNQSIYKLGVIYRLNQRFTLRGGWNYGTGQIPKDEILFNLLVPSVLEQHVTAGLSFEIKKNNQISIGYMHAFEQTVRDPRTSFFGAPASGWAQGDGFDIGYSRTF